MNRMKIVNFAASFVFLSATVEGAKKQTPLLRGVPSTERFLQQHDWTSQIVDFKPMVVNIETSSEVVFGTQSPGTGFATGFIVDAEQGIIATNQHVTGTSPSQVKVSFFDGSFTEAKVLYYDPTHDFGFYKINPDDVQFELREVTLGSWPSLQLGDEVLLIGNNEVEECKAVLDMYAFLSFEAISHATNPFHQTLSSLAA